MNRRAGTALVLAALAGAGCSYRALSFWLDGVPPPPPRTVAESGAAAPAARPAALVEHAPYAEKQCDACHVAGRSNGLVAANGELCAACHELGTGKKYVHGPIASGGGCLVCHDPHSSRNEKLLVADSATFCLHCHDRGDVLSSHGGAPEQCTSCHDAHMSDNAHLLK